MRANLPQQRTMRNGHSCVLRGVVMSVAIALPIGCAPKKKQPVASSPPTQQAILDAGFAALESQQYNQAIAKADEFLGSSPHGPGSPEALYLKGRALEGKNASGEINAEQV